MDATPPDSDASQPHLSNRPPSLPGPIPSTASVASHAVPDGGPVQLPLSKLAVASLALGIIPCVGLTGLGCGIAALVQFSRFPNRQRGKSLAIAGVVISGIMGVGIFPIAILAGMLLPALAKAKGKAQEINCVNNLKMLGLGVRIYGSDHDDEFPTNALDFRQHVSLPKAYTCPADQTHAAATTMDGVSGSNLSYQWLVTKQGPVQPNQVLCICTNHRNVAIVLMADGSVQRIPAGQTRSLVLRPEGTFLR